MRSGPSNRRQRRLAHAALAALLLACGAAAAAPCEPLRREIEAKIARAGVAAFRVTAVAAGASVPGKVVGSCEQGAMKIVYERLARADGEARPAPASAPTPAKAPTPLKRSNKGVITECKDGSIVRGGDCTP